MDLIAKPDESIVKEITAEISEIATAPSDVIDNVCESAQHNLCDAVEELAKPKPNICKVIIYTILAIFASVGTPLGVWIAARG